jgi:hypothetical protein
VSGRSLLGLVLLNLYVLAVGCGVLWGVRGWRTWLELLRLAGFAYMLGVAGLGIALTLGLVVGIPFSLATVLLIGVALAGAGIGVGMALRRPRPLLGGGIGRIGLAAGAVAALIVVYLEAVFRSARLAGLYAWDAWAFWVPKAKAIYFFGGLDEQFFRELPNPTYPPLVPALEAAAFEFMGSPDVITLHVQFWFFLVGFAAAVAGLLAPRVPGLLVGAFLLLVLVSPRIVRPLDPQADFLLDYQFALAALLVGLWLVERQPWQLASATLLLGAVMLTKREGQLLAACVIAAALAASLRDWRRSWPRIGVAAAVAFAIALPWRIWFSSRDLTGEFPSSGVTGLLDTLDRAWPALEAVLATAFDDGLWTVAPPLALAAVVLAFLGGARMLPAYAALVYGLALAGFTWALWSFVELELPVPEQSEAINPVVRLTASIVLLTAALTPLLLDAAWRGTDRPRRPEAG